MRALKYPILIALGVLVVAGCLLIVGLIQPTNSESAAPRSNCAEGDCENGIGRKHFPGPQVYYGAFSGGLRHGVGMLVEADGTRYSGNWKKDLRHGEGAIQYPDLRIF